jgi:uncharacterized SAM-binding protein YcdF (DUF218 family)
MNWLRGILLACATGLFVAFGIGFWTFAERVERSGPRNPVPEADAIVALTGGSQARLHEAVALLRAGHGRRLLISGVGRGASDEAVYALIGAASAEERAAITLGRQALDTLGNASETATWVKAQSARTLLVVTDDYHMPRALAELRLAMPDTHLIAHPVRSRWSAPQAWRSDLRAAAVIGLEYIKYLVVEAREGLLAIDDPPAAGGKAGA